MVRARRVENERTNETWTTPAPRQLRAMPQPAVPHRQGVSTSYTLPSGGGQCATTRAGRSPPTAVAADAAALAAYAAQRWQVVPSGTAIVCTSDFNATTRGASVIVQLYEQAIQVAVGAHEQWQRRRAQRLTRVNRAREAKGEPPLQEMPLTREEQTWEGGPGFSVARANVALTTLLEVEQRQGFPFTAAAVGDGSWDKSTGRVARAALLHDGTVLGGRIGEPGAPGGPRDNYDGELAHLIDLLHHLAPAQRVLIIFDSTSPVTASERFRRATKAARGRMTCDDWHATYEQLEQRHAYLHYFWQRSHQGQLPEAAADALAKARLGGEPVPVPRLPGGRHVTVRLYGRGGERALVLAVLTRAYVKTMKLGEGMRATAEREDLLRGARLCERDVFDVAQLRSCHARLQANGKVYPANGPLKIGALLRREGCPCGQGQQDVAHMLWWCQLPTVVRIRREQLQPAVVRLDDALDIGSVGSGQPISAACRVALREGEAPKGRSGYLGITPVSITDEDMASRAVAHVLGLVEECEGAREARAPVAKCAHAMLEAAAQMLRATEAASAKSTAAAGRNALRLQLLHGALGWMRGWIWMHPRARQPGLATGSLDERRAAPWRTAATTAYGQLEATHLGSEIRPVTAEALRSALVRNGVRAAIEAAQAAAAAKATAVGHSLVAAALFCDVLEQEADGHAALGVAPEAGGAAGGRGSRDIARERARRQAARGQLEWLHGRAKARATAWQATVEWWKAFAASSHRRMLFRTRAARKGAAAAAKASEAAAARRAKRPAADDGERERRRQMRGTAEEEAAAAAIAPPRPATSAPRKKRAMVTWGAANEAVLARIDESRRAQVSSQIWAVARTAAANIRRQVGEGARGKRVAEWPAEDAGARAPVRRRTGGGGSSSDDMIL